MSAVVVILLSTHSLAAQESAAGQMGMEKSVVPPAAPIGVVQPSRRLSDPEELRNPTFRWEPALAQSGFFIGIMHAWRLSTERGTRDALTGPWFNDYVRSVGSLRGWDDGDTFFTSYVGHPMEGAVFGYIQQQNDPRYRDVEFGEGRAYWMSRLRALGWSAIMSTLWTLGPASEASIGNVQLHASPGFVDLVGTPLLGTAWMVTEDIVDRYLITWVENRTANPWILMLVRGFGNPTRSFARAMSLRQPWMRDSRPDLFLESHKHRAQVLRTLDEPPKFGQPAAYSYDSKWRPWRAESALGPHPVVAPIEFQATAHYERFIHGGSCVGGDGRGSFRASPDWQLLAEVSGCSLIGLPAPQSGDVLSYMVGTRWTPHPASRWSPHAEFLIGGRRITQEIPNATRQDVLLNEWEDHQLQHYPMRSAYQVQLQSNGPSLAAGAGVDVRVNSVLALQLTDLQYTHSWIPRVGNYDASQGIRLETGLILRIGTW